MNNSFTRSWKATVLHRGFWILLCTERVKWLYLTSIAELLTFTLIHYEAVKCLPYRFAISFTVSRPRCENKEKKRKPRGKLTGSSQGAFLSDCAWLENCLLQITEPWSLTSNESSQVSNSLQTKVPHILHCRFLSHIRPCFQITLWRVYFIEP